MEWKESLEKQSLTLSNLLMSQELEFGVKSLLEISKDIKGFHYFTGIGKNTFVAARVASTFDSLGIRSMYVDPINTLHGSMGIFTDSDLLIAISKSGETEELNRFLQALTSQGFKRIVGVTSNVNSTMCKLSMFSIFVPIADEGDHLGLAPIASTMAFSAILDAVAVHLSSEKGYNRSDFVRNHPGGSLGKTVL